MRSSMFFLNVVLGLLFSLIVAATPVHDAAVGGNVPIYSSLKEPFILRSRHPDGAHVVVNGDGTPVVTFDKRASTVFTLSDGELSIFRTEVSAIYGPVPLPLPPRLIPIRFVKSPPPQIKAPFLAVTDQETLTLAVLGGRRSKK